MTEINKTSKVSIGLIIAVIPLVAGAVVWYDGRQDDEHTAIETNYKAADTVVAQASYVANRDTELELIDAKLKLYRMIREHRELTADEKADEEWLKERKQILLKEKRERRS